MNKPYLKFDKDGGMLRQPGSSLVFTVDVDSIGKGHAIVTLLGDDLPPTWRIRLYSDNGIMVRDTRKERVDDDEPKAMATRVEELECVARRTIDAIDRYDKLSVKDRLAALEKNIKEHRNTLAALRPMVDLMRKDLTTIDLTMNERVRSLEDGVSAKPSGGVAWREPDPGPVDQGSSLGRWLTFAAALVIAAFFAYGWMTGSL